MIYVCLKDALKELLKRGASLDVYNHRGLTPVHIAASYGYMESLTFMIKRYKANFNVKYLDMCVMVPSVINQR